MNNEKEFDPWPIDGKCFCQDIVTDFAELKALGGSVAYGNLGYGLNSVAFYTSECSHDCDELVEMIWPTDSNCVFIRCGIPSHAEQLASKYKQWVEECEDDGKLPYKCFVTPIVENSGSKVIVGLYKESEE